MCIKINKFGKQEVGIWWVQKRFPWYGVPIWSLRPNIRSLPSIVAEKNVTKNVHVWSQASYRYAILWEAFLDPSDSYFLFANLVGFYTYWTYMHIFRHIFLSNYWWQRSDIWSQASYRYPISWEAFLDPSDSYFLFADFVDFYTHWTYILYMPISSHIFLSISLKNHKWSFLQDVNCELMLTYDTPALRQTGSRNLTGQKTLPTIWHTYMKLVTKYQISAINKCWEKCD
jgi:hypothetical protein